MAARNLVRSLRREGLDFVVLPIRGSYPERASRRDPLPFPFSRLPIFPTEISLEDVRWAFERLGDDRRVRGVVLRFDALHAGPAALHTLRRLVADLRAQGKRVVAWLPSADTWDYYLASACDEVILAPPGQLSVLGLRAEAVFLKDALALVGVEADLESIAEYKTAPDAFLRSTMSEPHREMLDAILGVYFDEIVAAIAEERGLDPAQVRELIDAMPITPAEAVEAGLIDALLYEDELTARLRPGGEGGESDPALVTWEEALRWMRRPIRWTTRRTVGVVSLEGLIVPGRSRRIPLPVPLPFVGGQAGAESVVQALRRAEADERIAAVILHIESPGGSALASDLVYRAVRRLRERKPVVALMGEQAASGGYYVAAPAHCIVARPTTLTGSIGVWGGKFMLGGLYEKLGVRRESLQRGAMAGLYSDLAPFSEEERARVRREMGQSYARFKRYVAEGRGMTESRVEEVARGRVWTGAQAREVGLVDELGDFETALAMAKELAGLKPGREYTIVPLRPGRRELLPPPFPAGDGDPAAWFSALRGLARERVWALAPWVVQMQA